MRKAAAMNGAVGATGRGVATAITGALFGLLMACGGSESDLSLPLDQPVPPAPAPAPMPAPAPTPAPPPAPPPTPQPPAAPTITQHPANVSVTVGATARFSVAATAPDDSLTITWQQSLDGGVNWVSTSTTGLTLSLPAVAIADDGKRFRARACSTVGTLQTCVDSNSALLTVSAPPPPSLPLAFAASDGVKGVELWITDGTETGTVLVQDILPGTSGSNPAEFTRIGSYVYFTAQDGVTGTELWRTDGTAASLVADIRTPGLNSSLPRGLTACNGHLFFGAYDGTGYAVFKADGVTGAVSQLARVALVIEAPRPTLCIGGVFYFVAIETSLSPSELWRSDGTVAGTWRVAPGTGASGLAGELGELGGAVYFASQGKLWRSDGSPDGTQIISSTAGGASDFATIDGRLYFAASTPEAGDEPWISDGTVAGTRMIVDLVPGSTGSRPERFVGSGGNVYFGIRPPSSTATGLQLVRTDGTAAGTRWLPPNDVTMSAIDSVIDLGGVLYFSARDADRGRELWRTDGTDAGTFIVRDIAPGTSNSSPAGFVRIGSTILFRATDPNFGTELWTSDGTEAGTRLLKDLCVSCSSSPRFR